MTRSLFIEKPDDRLSGQQQFLEATLLAIGIFMLPLLLRQPQILVGTAVNMALALGALHLGSWRLLAPLVVLPAIAAVLGGVLFDSHVTIGLLCLVPGIWAGNALYVAVLRIWGRGSGKGLYPMVLLGASLGKMLVIGTVALLLAWGSVLPWVLVAAFVPLQVVTAMFGGLLAVPAGMAIKWFARR